MATARISGGRLTRSPKAVTRNSRSVKVGKSDYERTSAGTRGNDKNARFRPFAGPLSNRSSRPNAELPNLICARGLPTAGVLAAVDAQDLARHEGRMLEIEDRLGDIAG